jgi:hypothetical protein
MFLLVLFPFTSNKLHLPKSPHMMTSPTLSFRPQDSLDRYVETKSNPEATILKYINFLTIMPAKKPGNPLVAIM